MVCSSSSFPLRNRKVLLLEKNVLFFLIQLLNLKLLLSDQLNIILDKRVNEISERLLPSMDDTFSYKQSERFKKEEFSKNENIQSPINERKTNP